MKAEIITKDSKRVPVIERKACRLDRATATTTTAGSGWRTSSGRCLLIVGEYGLEEAGLAVQKTVGGPDLH